MITDSSYLSDSRNSLASDTIITSNIKNNIKEP